MSLVAKLCWRLVNFFPHRTKIIKTDDNYYLLRFYIKHNNLFPGVYLHYFYRGDTDRDLHNHPWKWAFSFILTGGYYEERYAEDGTVSRNLVKPGTFNFLTHKDFHRVDLLDDWKGCWTIFVSGKEVQDWGFKDRSSGQYIPHTTYLGLSEPFVDQAPYRDFK